MNENLSARGETRVYEVFGLLDLWNQCLDTTIGQCDYQVLQLGLKVWPEMCLLRDGNCQKINLLDKVFLNLLSDTYDVGDAGLLKLREVLLAGGSVGAKVETRDDLLHVSPHSVGPVIHRAHHEAISFNVNVLSLFSSSSVHLYGGSWGLTSVKRLRLRFRVVSGVLLIADYLLCSSWIYK